MSTSIAIFTDPMPEPPYSIRAKTRTAIASAVLEGEALATTAQREGVAVATLEAALDRPEVRAYINALKDWKDRRDAAMRQGYLGEAIDRARHLMLNSDSEQTQARMIEFLHRALAPRDDGGKPAPLVQIAQHIAPGYAYPAPLPAVDQRSQAGDSQAIEGKAQSLDE